MQVPWQSVLQKYINTICNKTESFWSDKRIKSSLGVNVPDERNLKALGNVVLAIDTSGSVSESELGIYTKELGKLLKPYSIKNLYILQADRDVKTDQIIHLRNPRAIPTTFKLVGGGGTNFQAVFDWVSQNIRGTPDLMIYFTDGQENAPKHVSWSKKLIWFVTQSRSSNITRESMQKQNFEGNFIIVTRDGNNVSVKI